MCVFSGEVNFLKAKFNCILFFIQEASLNILLGTLILINQGDYWFAGHDSCQLFFLNVYISFFLSFLLVYLYGLVFFSID
jgi:hypothetical protein